MADRAHIRLVDTAWTFQRAFNGTTNANGDALFFRAEDGRKVDLTLAPIGYQVGNDKLVAATETVNNTTAGGEPVTENTPWTVEVDGSACSRTITIRDKTALEISDEKDAILANLDIASRNELYALAIVVKGALSLMYQTTGNYNNLTQFKNAFEANEDTITNAQFKTFLKDRLG